VTVTERQPVTSSSDDFVLIDNGVTSSKTTHKEQQQHRTTSTDFVIRAESEPDYNHSRPKYGERKSSFLSIIRDPLVLAGIIGGGVLALLCIVLLIMFMIYRMRKKDEGSYALEDPSRRKYDIRYTRTEDQEFLG